MRHDDGIEGTYMEDSLAENSVNWNIMEIYIMYGGRPDPTLVLEFRMFTKAIMGIIVKVKMSMIMISNIKVNVPYFLGT